MNIGGVTVNSCQTDTVTEKVVSLSWRESTPQSKASKSLQVFRSAQVVDGVRTLVSLSSSNLRLQDLEDQYLHISRY